MRIFLALLLLLQQGISLGQDQEIQRALVQRDQQSAEFAAQLRGAQDLRWLEALHAAQLRDAHLPLSADPLAAKALLPYQRELMSQERELRFALPVVRAPLEKPKPDAGAPLALPGGPRAGVDPVAPDSLPR
jgi:hypothetical protein